MTKKDVKVTIDEDLLKDAKKSIPILSQFFTGCLEYYLGKTPGTYDLITEQQILEEIGNLQAKLYMNKTKFNVEEEYEKAKQFEIDKTWRLTFREYYQMKGLPDEKIKESAETLGVSAEEFAELLQLVSIFRNDTDVDLDEWDVVLEAFRNDKII